ncbi:MAG: hypothetical protein ACE5PT_12075 [Gemmatimonadales bacterium]
MTIITVNPAAGDDLYGLLLEKERELRRAGRGTLHRKGPRKRGQEKWVHTSYKGHIRLQKRLGGVLVAAIQGRGANDEWQLSKSFVGFLHRHFRDEISGVTLAFGAEEG